MGFNNPYAWALLPLVGLIILMYMLKQQHEEMEISSLYLWEKVLAQSEVKKPWQKLKNNILMLMQLLAAFLIIMALSNPFLTKGKALGGNIIIVIDRSGSMNASYEGKTRLDIAKSMAEKAIVESDNSSVFTLISIDKTANVEFSGVADKQEAIKAVESLEKTNMSGSIKVHLSLIKSIYKQFESANVLIYTDEEVALEDMSGEIIALGGYGSNVGIGHISYSQDSGEYTVLVRVENSSQETEKRELALYGEDRLLGLKDLELAPGESSNVLFEGIDTVYKYLMAELTEEDDLPEDNRAYLVLESTDPKSVLLFSEKNIFIEKALSSIKGLEVYKTDDINISAEGYDLYIFDGIMPTKLPDDGSLFFVNPREGNPYFKSGETIEGGRADILEHSLNENIDGYNFYIGKMKALEKPYWADALIKVGNNTAAGAGVYEGRKIAYTAFDIHDSDFPLDASFPIFMYNIAAYLTDMEHQGKSYYFTGEIIPLNFISGIQEAVMEDPDGKKTSIGEELLDYGYSDTNSIGIYKLSYKKDQDERERILAVNFPREEGIDAFQGQWEGERKEGNRRGYSLMGLNLQAPIIIFVLLLLAAEWMVYIRGN
ncbi:MAG: VWA domain-containing protein [Clostridiales bacterium]|nr:VWA domain-containing protein [Clostridiales bacterium]